MKKTDKSNGWVEEFDEEFLRDYIDTNYLGEIKDHVQTLLDKAVKAEHVRIIKVWNKHCKEYSPVGAGENGDWCDRFATKLTKENQNNENTNNNKTNISSKS